MTFTRADHATTIWRFVVSVVGSDADDVTQIVPANETSEVVDLIVVGS